MTTLKLMHAKLHRFRVTSANRDYVGSITIDAELLDAVGILPLEEVEIVNVDNGQRWSTYVLPGEPGSGVIAPNGGGALLCTPGDVLIVYAYQDRARADVLASGHQARIAIGDDDNRVAEFRRQALVPAADGLRFEPGAAADPSAPSDAVEASFGVDRLEVAS